MENNESNKNSMNTQPSSHAKNQCPSCGAELPEGARYCLYCMTSLSEKNVIPSYQPVRQRLLPYAGFFFFIALVVVYLLISGISDAVSRPQNDRKKGDAQASDAPAFHSPSSQIPATQKEHTEETVGESEESDVSVIPGPDTDAGTEEDSASDSEKSDASFPSSSSNKTSNTNTTSDRSSNKTTDTGSVSSSTKSGPVNTLTDRGTENTPTDDGSDPSDEEYISGTYYENGVTWTYRSPTQLSEFPSKFFESPPALSEVVMITGFSTVSSTGVYRIPRTIRGRMVAMVRFEQGSKYTFVHPDVQSNIKAIYFPPECKGVSSGPTFAGTIDIYVASDVFFVGVGWKNQTGNITFHFADTCKNGGGTLLKDQILSDTYTSATMKITHQNWDSTSVYPN